MNHCSGFGAAAAIRKETSQAEASGIAAYPLALEVGNMTALLQPGGPRLQLLPCQGQPANAKSCVAWRPTVPGACQLTSLRDWSLYSAAPTSAPSSRKSRRNKRAVLTAATADVPEWDVVALGQSMVDISAYVDDDFVDQMGVVKGGRR